MSQIPKVIHYCWFGKGDKPELAKKCIESWKKYCPDYEIKEWNEDNFDINKNQYIKEAYDARKYAFVTDYVRLYVLYNNGGIYMDTDVEILKPIDIFLKHKAFSSFENNNMIPTGIIGSQKQNIWIKDLLDEYDNLRFVKEDGTYDLTTNVDRITKLTEKKYGLKKLSTFQELKDGIVTIYPYEYFCPKDWETGNINITENTYAIHHFSGSWHTDKQKKGTDRYRKKLKKYINKYGDEIGRIKLNRRQNIKYYIMHPASGIKKIKEILLKKVKK